MKHLIRGLLLFGGVLLALSHFTASTQAQASVTYTVVSAYYQDQVVFYYVFENGTPVLDNGARVGVVDQYRLVDSQDNPIEGQYDIIPSGGAFSESYSDLRELVLVQVNDDYEANSLTSVEELEAADLLSESNIERTGITINMPLAFRGAVLQGHDYPLESLWEGGNEVYAFNFGETPAAAAPIYRLVIDDEGTPIDGRFAVIAQMHDDEGYSDFWQVFDVRVPADTPPNSIRSYEQIVEAGYPIQATSNVINCPAIRLENMAMGYIDDRLYYTTRVLRPDLTWEDTLAAAYYPEQADAPQVLELGPNNEGYTGLCEGIALENTPDLLTNSRAIEQNADILQTRLETVYACGVLEALTE